MGDFFFVFGKIAFCQQKCYGRAEIRKPFPFTYYFKYFFSFLIFSTSLSKEKDPRQGIQFIEKSFCRFFYHESALFATYPALPFVAKGIHGDIAVKAAHLSGTSRTDYMSYLDRIWHGVFLKIPQTGIKPQRQPTRYSKAITIPASQTG